MEYIFVTLIIDNGDGIDMKIPANMTADEFAKIIRGVYRAAGKQLHAEPQGIFLAGDETFFGQMIENGSVLTLR